MSSAIAASVTVNAMTPFKHSAAWAQLTRQIRQAELTASGEQFYLAEFERASLIVATAEARDDRPPPLSLNDEAEYDYEGEDDAESSSR